MTVTKEKKEAVLTKLNSTVKNAEILVFLNCIGLKSEEMNAVRKSAFNSQCLVGIFKNTLITKACEDNGIALEPNALKYPTTLFSTDGDIVALAKEIKKISEKHESVEFKAAFMGQQSLDENGLKRLASLPSQEVLLGELLVRMNTPIQKLVTVLSGPVRNFVCGLNQIKELKEKEVK